MAHGTIFVAGAGGAIGQRLLPILVEDGWRIFGTTRSADRCDLLRELGAEPIVVDVFDHEALADAVGSVRPDVLMHQLTDLPYALEADKLGAALQRNARLRDEGTRNLLDAGRSAGARRVVAQSISFLYADGPLPHSESDPLQSVDDPRWGVTAAGVRSLEHQVARFPGEGLVLRYGLLYGPGTGFDAPLGPGSVHVDAAAKAAAVAAAKGLPGVYNIAEDDGAVTTDFAAQQLGWNASWRLPS